ncbi:MAG: M1 family aminopeptidase, partial [bacterium]
MISRILLLLLALTLQGRAGSLFGSDTLSRPSRCVDILHYKIEVRFDEKNKKVFGTTVISFVPLWSKLDSLQLNAVEMDVQSVTMYGKPLVFFNDRKQLMVKLDKFYSFNDTLRIVVDYTCSPAKGLYFTSPDSINPDRRTQIWTQGEDMDNRYWFPCWDFPNDKATSEVIATVRDSWTVLSNGRLVDTRTDKKMKTKTFHWLESKPHASYLVMLVAGEYTILSEKYKNLSVDNYAYNDRIEDTRRSLSATTDVLKFMEQATGFTYPWEKLAQIFIQDFMWGGMENTSAITYNESYLIDRRGMVDFSGDDVVAHEVAHQWFGDVVTCRDWSELWLNESFANYYEARYKKYSKGSDEFLLDMMNQAAGVMGAERSQGRQPIVSQDNYAANLYSKGAWVLHMLESILGEQEFNRAIHLYLQRNAFSNVSTFDFQKAVEEATGRNLDWFFRQWVFKGGHPQLTVTSSWDEATKFLTLSVEQTQKVDSLTGVFKLPVDIECTTASGSSLQTIYLSQQQEKFEI